MKWRVPSKPRTWVVLTPTLATVPVTEPMMTVSPTSYWRSSKIKKPFTTSLRNPWAPKPKATPAIPAPANRLVIGMPKMTKIQ